MNRLMILPEATAACAQLVNLSRREGELGPLMVGETEGDIVGKTVVLEQQFELVAARGAVEEVGTAPAENVIRAFGKDGLVAHVFHGAGKGVVVNQLGIAEDHGPDAEQLLDAVVVLPHLRAKFLRRIEEGKRCV